MSEMRISIQYCGGCNPRYDRIAAVEYLRARLPGCLLEPVQEGRAYDLCLEICGCETGCTVPKVSRVPVWRVSCEEDVFQVEQNILSIQKGATQWIGKHCIGAD